MLIVWHLNFSRPLNINVVPLNPDSVRFTEDVAGIILQYPNTEGLVHDIKSLIDAANANGVSVWYKKMEKTAIK